MRIMKSRKKLRRVELIDDVLHMCNTRFTPPIPLINDCIKALVSKDYMEHDMQTDELVYT